jgi:hypothetical protein
MAKIKLRLSDKIITWQDAIQQGAVWYEIDDKGETKYLDKDNKEICLKKEKKESFQSGSKES